MWSTGWLVQGNYKYFSDPKITKHDWAPNTGKTHLNSLRVYVNFLEKSKVAGHSEFKVYDSSHLNGVMDDILDSKRGLERLSNKTKVAPSDEGQYVNPSDLERYFISEEVASVKDILQQEGPVEECTPADVLSIRNFIIFCICITNGCRTRCLINMTLREFVAGKGSTRTAHHVVKVSNHKTSAVYGPAEIIFSLELYKYMECYTSYYRPKSAEFQLLLNLTGSPMNAGIMGNVLSWELQKGRCAQKA